MKTEELELRIPTCPICKEAMGASTNMVLCDGSDEGSFVIGCGDDGYDEYACNITTWRCGCTGSAIEDFCNEQNSKTLDQTGA